MQALNDEGVILRDALSRRMSKVGSLFALADLDGDGFVSRSEFRHVAMLAVGNFDVPPQALDDLFDELDHDGSGELDYAECVRYMLRDGLRRSAHRVRDLFTRLDADDNGTLDKAEFRSALALLGWEAHDHPHLIDEVFELMDADSNGVLSYAEVYKSLRQGVGMGKFLDPLLATGAAGSITTHSCNRHALRGSLDEQYYQNLAQSSRTGRGANACAACAGSSSSSPRLHPPSPQRPSPQRPSQQRPLPVFRQRSMETLHEDSTSGSTQRLPALSPRQRAVEQPHVQPNSQPPLSPFSPLSPGSESDMGSYSPRPQAVVVHAQSALEPLAPHPPPRRVKQHGKKSPRLDILKERAEKGGFTIPVVRKRTAQEDMAEDLSGGCPAPPGTTQQQQSYRCRMPVHVTAGYRWAQPLPAATGDGQLALSRRLDEDSLDRVKAERYDKQRRVDYAAWSRGA